MHKIEYGYDAADRIALPTSKPPFDGSDVLIKLDGIGWVEAWWSPDHWCCLGGKVQADLDDATHWAPLPVALCEAPRCNCPDRKMVANGFAECVKHR